jgi:nucleoside-triphosphatase THEP1
MSSIYIFTDEIKSGKTTRLGNWAAGNPDTDGILAPVIGGKRHLSRIKNKESRILEYEGSDTSVELTKIGSYNFIKSVFEWGQKELLDAMLQNPRWLIVDEIGPLELKGGALEPAVSSVLKNSLPDVNIILVVRKTLVDKVIVHYGLDKKGFKLFEI